MTTGHRPTLAEDARHLSLIATAGFLALAASAFFSTPSPPAPPPPPPPRELPPPPPPAPVAGTVRGSGRIYGRVVTTVGAEATGYLRWNGRESSWTDLLPAVAVPNGALAGFRFGHVARIERGEGATIEVELKSGRTTTVALAVGPGEAGPAPLTVESVGRGTGAIDWSDVASIDLFEEPAGSAPPAPRLHGTVVTRSGVRLTGDLLWEAAVPAASHGAAGAGPGPSTVEAGGEPAVGGASALSGFSAIERRADGRLYGLTAAGAAIEVGEGRRGSVTVADPALGTAVVPLARLRALRLHPATRPPRYDSFDGGRPLRGTVTTADGRTITGLVRWDRDEAETWQMLDGQLDGLRLHVELGEVASIEKSRWGATVELRDGRSLYMLGTNDVGWSNRGIEVTDDLGAVRTISWSDFRRVDLDG